MTAKTPFRLLAAYPCVFMFFGGVLTGVAIRLAQGGSGAVTAFVGGLILTVIVAVPTELLLKRIRRWGAGGRQTS